MSFLKMSRRATGIGLAVLIVTTLFPLSEGFGAEWLSGKTITIDVPTSAGGGYDFLARLVARYIPNYLPGQPASIVKNMPGAGGVLLATHLYASAPTDGTEFAILPDTSLFLPLIRNERLHYDARGFGYLGALAKFVPIIIEWKSAAPKTFDDALKVSMSVGSDGVGDATDYFPRVLNTVFGTKFNIVRGYGGSTAITLAMERGEVDGFSWDFDSLKAQKPQWIAQHSARVLVQLSFEGNDELNVQGVPKIGDIARTVEQRQVAKLAFSGALIARPFVTPPNVDPKRLAELQTAFSAVARDPDFLADAQKAGFDIRFSLPQTMREIVSEVYATDPQLVGKVRTLMSD
jgi:tripartite-type tricarboxylate transporter receptor subunit TctC